MMNSESGVGERQNMRKSLSKNYCRSFLSFFELSDGIKIYNKNSFLNPQLKMWSASRKNVQQQQQRTNILGKQVGQSQTQNQNQNRALGRTLNQHQHQKRYKSDTNKNDNNENKCKNKRDQRQNQTVALVDPEKEMTFQDLKYTFSAFELALWLKIVPAEMDSKSKVGKIDPDEKVTRKRDFLYGLWQGFVRLRITFLIYGTIHTIWNFNEQTSIIKILGNFLTIFITFVSTGLYFGYFEATAHNMRTILTFLNGLTESLKTSSNQHQNQNQNQNVEINGITKLKRLVRSILKRPLSVSLLIYLPFVIYSLMIIPNGFMLLDPDSPVLLSSYALSLFGSGIFRTFAYMFLIMVDHLYYFFMMTEIYIAVFVMLFFIIQIQNETDMSIEKLRLLGADADGLEKATKSLQVIKLLILFFNSTFSTIIYLTKLIALAAAVIGGFLMIKLIHTHPLFTLPFALIFLEGNIIHTLLFDKVYRITEKVEQLKEEILIKAQNTNTNTNFRDRGKNEEYKKICQSVQRLGIQAGRFYLMERENTLIFVGFVLQKIVDLLLTFN